MQQTSPPQGMDVNQWFELRSQLQNLLNTDQSLATELKGVLNQLGANNDVDILIAGQGTDHLYGNLSAPTSMVGDPVVGTIGDTTFYNYNASDTVQGGQGANTLMLQGDGDFILNHTPTIPVQVLLTPHLANGQNGPQQEWDIGNGMGGLSGIGNVGVQMTDGPGGSDTATVNFGTWAGLLPGGGGAHPLRRRQGHHRCLDLPRNMPPCLVDRATM